MNSCQADASDPRTILPDLSDADLLLWTGDLNYRIDNVSYGGATSLISRGRLDALLSHDQLRSEMAAGHVFVGMWEPEVAFPPTYKFDRGTGDPLGERKISF